MKRNEKQQYKIIIKRRRDIQAQVDRSEDPGGQHHHRSVKVPKHTGSSRKQAGLSLVEMLISLAITAMLLTATMVAIDASFYAYASAAESASTQTSTRLVINRLLTLVRTSTAHGPLLNDAGVSPPVVFIDNEAVSSYIELIDSSGNLLVIDYRPDGVNPDNGTIFVTTTPYGSVQSFEQPLISGVRTCEFQLRRRKDYDGVWVLERGSINFEVVPESGNTLALAVEQGGGTLPPIQVVASTMPRKLD